MPEGWRAGALIALSDSIVNAHHIERIMPRGLGQARIAFVSGKTMDCEEPFTMVMSLVVGALQPNGSAQEKAE